MTARAIEFGTKALKLACHYQNRFCEQQEVIEMFCLDAKEAQKGESLRRPLDGKHVKAIMESAINNKSEMGDMEYVAWIIGAVERAHNIGTAL